MNADREAQLRQSQSQVLRRLSTASRYRLTVLLAPPGWGKTRLLHSWTAAQPLPVAWLALESDDNQVLHFLQRLAGSLQMACPTCPIQLALANCRDDDPGDPVPTAEVCLVEMLNALLHAPHDLLLVLDGYEQITAASVHRMVTQIITYPPPQLHMLIASQIAPPLPLAHLMVRRQMLELILEND